MNLNASITVFRSSESFITEIHFDNVGLGTVLGFDTAKNARSTSSLHQIPGEDKS
jgi:hypothetical protein